MTEERLKEIKDSIYCLEYDFAVRSIGKTFTSKHLQQERELYNEVIRLRETLNKINHVMNNQMNYREFVDIVNAIDDILKQNKLTLEQLTGVENA